MANTMGVKRPGYDRPNQTVQPGYAYPSAAGDAKSAPSANHGSPSGPGNGGRK